MEIHRNSFKFIEIHSNSLKFIEIHWNSLKFIEIHWNSFKIIISVGFISIFDRNQLDLSVSVYFVVQSWCFRKICVFDYFRHPPGDTHGHPRISHGHSTSQPRTSTDIHGYPRIYFGRKSIEIQRADCFPQIVQVWVWFVWIWADLGVNLGFVYKLWHFSSNMCGLVQKQMKTIKSVCIIVK